MLTSKNNASHYISSWLTQWLTAILIVAITLTTLFVAAADAESDASTTVVPYYSNLYPPNMVLLLLDDGHLEAYDPLRTEKDRFLWATNTTAPIPVGHKRPDTRGLHTRESITATPSLSRAAVDPLALPFIVRGNRLFTRLPLWSQSDSASSATASPDPTSNAASPLYRTNFYHGNLVDNSLPDEVQPYFFMNVSTLIRRQRVHVRGTEIYVTTSVTFDDIDSFTGRVVYSSEESHRGATLPAHVMDTPVHFPKLHLTRHTLTIHAYCPGEYQWTIELPSVDLTENAALATAPDAVMGATLAPDDANDDGSSEAERGRTTTPPVRSRVSQLAKIFETIRGAVRPPGSLHNLHAPDAAECERQSGSVDDACTKSEYPATPRDIVLSQDVDGAVKIHHVDPKNAKLVVTALPTPSLIGRSSSTVAAAFLYTPQRSDRPVQRVPLFYADAALSGDASAHLRLLSQAPTKDPATSLMVRDALSVPALLTNNMPTHDEHFLRPFNEGFRDIDLEAEDVEGIALEQVFAGYGHGGDVATLYRRMMMSSTELAKELSLANTDAATSSFRNSRTWRYALIVLLNAMTLAGSLALILAGTMPRGRLLSAWAQSDRYRHRPTATPKLAHHHHPLSAAGAGGAAALLSPQLLFSTTADSQEFSSPSAGESFDTLPSATESGGSPRLATPHTAVTENAAMARATRWSTAAPSSSSSNESASSSSSSAENSSGSEGDTGSDSDSEDGGTSGSSNDGSSRRLTRSLGADGETDPRSRNRRGQSRGLVTSEDDNASGARGGQPGSKRSSGAWGSGSGSLAAHHGGSARPSKVDQLSTQNGGAAAADGRLFQEHFRIISRVGAGGEGCVFCVEHRVTHVKYAVKAVHIQEQDEKRVVQEAVLHSAFDNPHVVRFYFCWIQNISMHDENAMQLRALGDGMDDLSMEYSSSAPSGLQFSNDDLDDDDRDHDDMSSDEEDTYRMLFIQMEYFPYGTLADELSNRSSFYRIDNLQYIKQIVEGLDYLHDMDVVHRDLKPTNIFISVETRYTRMADASRGGHVDGRAVSTTDIEARHKMLKIGDFGLAKQRNTQAASLADMAGNVAGGLNEQSIVGGTPLYCSPEQLAGKASGKPTDIFSLGIIGVELYCLFTTYHERSRVLTEARNQQLPEDLTHQFPQEAKLFASMLSPYPNRRPTAASVLTQIESLIEKQKDENRSRQQQQQQKQQQEQRHQDQQSLQPLALPTSASGPMSPSFADGPSTPGSAASPSKLWTGMMPSVSNSQTPTTVTNSTGQPTPFPSEENTQVSQADPQDQQNEDETAPLHVGPPSLMTSVKTLLMSPVSEGGPLSPFKSGREGPLLATTSAHDSAGRSPNGRHVAALSDWVGGSQLDLSSPSSVLAAATPTALASGKSRGTLFYRPVRSSNSVCSNAASTEDDAGAHSTQSAGAPPPLDSSALAPWTHSTLGARAVSMGALDDFLEGSTSAYGTQRVEVPYTDDPDFSAALRDGMKNRRPRYSVEKV